MSYLDDLTAYDHFMLGAANRDRVRSEMEAEVENALNPAAPEREDPTIGNEELLRGLPLFIEFRPEEGKLGLRKGRGSGIDGSMRGTRPGDRADRVHETITKMPHRFA